MKDYSDMIELPILEAHSAPARRDSVRQWRSLGHLNGDASLAEWTVEEFPPGASHPPSGSSRRQFLQLMGASMAMAGLSACRKPVEAILPYTRKPDEIIPGLSLFYATAMPFRGVVSGVLVESREGRPIKIEGNPEHPVSQGASGVFEQASILSLYDPDRSAQPLFDSKPSAWIDFLSYCRELSASAGTQRLAVLAEESSSRTMMALRSRLGRQFPRLRWVAYGAHNTQAEGFARAFGRSVRPVFRFSKADVIVSLGADFLSPTDRNFVANTREFAEGRRLSGRADRMSRLYVAESEYTVTGGSADHRLRMRSGDLPALAEAIAAELGLRPAVDPPGRASEAVRGIVDDLRAAGARGVVLAGEAQPPRVHELCAAINSALGSIGETIDLLDMSEDGAAATDSDDVNRLVDDMRRGEVDTLVMLGVNPVYDAPPALQFAEALSNVGHTIHFGPYVDETARLCRWHVPQSHFLEAWGDGRAYDGTLSVIQPLIAPLHSTRSAVELVAALATGEDASGYDLIRDSWRGRFEGDFEAAWRKVIHDGFLPGSGYDTVDLTAQDVAADVPLRPEGGTLEAAIKLHPAVLDGSFANNAWLQELPHPVTKIVWDNVAVMSPATADRLGCGVTLRNGQYFADIVAVSTGGDEIRLPVWVQPGQADDSVTLYLGYGRDISTTRPERSTNPFDTDDYTDVYGKGAIATGVGANVSRIGQRTGEHVIADVQVSRVGGEYLLATTQDHGALPEDIEAVERREPVRVATYEEFQKNPKYAGDAEPPLQGGEPWADYPALWENRHPKNADETRGNGYFANQWGMVIDLNACTGCNACVVACQSENNVQVVGKEEVSLGREMHWLRMDRYFVSSENDSAEPEMVVQPVPCMHCENAPCEAVCPVAATVHSPDGTNQMIYNRCIGTRYCANNCPYKVRRFNFYNWIKTLPDTVNMAHNPRVTVRSRGVMEKCSFCIHRVRAANERANLEDRTIASGEVQAACQQACPARAITFGDINDPNSGVSRERANPRRYELLAQLSVKPRTSYLGRVKNPNPELV
jgi:molybdopterin-containing oxidoreductase family iron-sulfur binding subunit